MNQSGVPGRREPKLQTSQQETKRLRAILKAAPGPTNSWFRTKYQPVQGPGGQRLVWGSNTQVMWAKMLIPEGSTSIRTPIYLSMGLMCYCLNVREDRLVIWRPVGRPPQGHALRVSLFDTMALEPMKRFARNKTRDPVAWTAGLLGTVDLPGTWAAGTYEIAFPQDMRSLDELLMILPLFPGIPPSAGRTPTRQLRKHVLTAFYVARLSLGTVEVVPLLWSNPFSRFRWIARAARDATTGNIVGDGYGVKPFLVDGHGRFLGWL